MTSRSFYSAFWHLPFQASQSYLPFHLPQESKLFSQLRETVAAQSRGRMRGGIPGSTWNPAALISLSRRQLGNRWQTKGSRLKRVPLWFLLIDLAAPPGENKLCWVSITCGSTPFISGVLLVRVQGDKWRKRGPLSLQHWLFCKSVLTNESRCKWGTAEMHN